MTSMPQSLSVTQVRTKPFSEDGQRLIRVPLFGKRGLGRSMVLDADVWRAGRKAGWPAGWVVIHEPRAERDYVVTSCKTVSATGKAVALARLVAKARPKDVISFVDGDTFNLRASNLFRGRAPGARAPYQCYEEIEEAEDVIASPVQPAQSAPEALSLPAHPRPDVTLVDFMAPRNSTNTAGPRADCEG